MVRSHHIFNIYYIIDEAHAVLLCVNQHKHHLKVFGFKFAKTSLFNYTNNKQCKNNNKARHARTEIAAKVMNFKI